MTIPPEGDPIRIQGAKPPTPVTPIPQVDAARFQKHLEGASASSPAPGSEVQAVQPTETPLTDRVRESMNGVDLHAPEAREVLTDRFVDGNISEQFGPEILQSPGADNLRREVREALLQDPGFSGLLDRILSGLGNGQEA